MQLNLLLRSDFMKNSTLITILISFLTFSCSDEEPNVFKGQFEEGIFVVNEGNFGESDGSISFINRNGAVVNEIFSSTNEGKLLGDVVQSLYAFGSRGFIVVNNSNRVEVVNLNTFESQYTLDNLLLPRYVVSDGTRAFITEWINFENVEGQVSVIEIESGETIKRIEVGIFPENLLIFGSNLYVTNNRSNTVSVIDLNTLEVTSTVEVGPTPGSMEFVNDKLYVLCSGGFGEDFTPLENGNITSIDINNFSTEIFEIRKNVLNRTVSNTQGRILFASGRTILSFDTQTSTFSELFTTELTSIYGLGITKENELLVADPRGFISSGEVFVFDLEGIVQESFTVGRAPNGFLVGD